MVIANLVYCTNCDKLIESEDWFMLLSQLPHNYSRYDGISIHSNGSSKVYCEKCATTLFSISIKQRFQLKKKLPKTGDKSK